MGYDDGEEGDDEDGDNPGPRQGQGSGKRRIIDHEGGGGQGRGARRGGRGGGRGGAGQGSKACYFLLALFRHHTLLANRFGSIARIVSHQYGMARYGFDVVGPLRVGPSRISLTQYVRGSVEGGRQGGIGVGMSKRRLSVCGSGTSRSPSSR